MEIKLERIMTTIEDINKHKKEIRISFDAQKNAALQQHFSTLIRLLNKIIDKNNKKSIEQLPHIDSARALVMYVKNNENLERDIKRNLGMRDRKRTVGKLKKIDSDLNVYEEQLSQLDDEMLQKLDECDVEIKKLQMKEDPLSYLKTNINPMLANINIPGRVKMKDIERKVNQLAEVLSQLSPEDTSSTVLEGLQAFKGENDYSIMLVFDENSNVYKARTMLQSVIDSTLARLNPAPGKPTDDVTPGAPSIQITPAPEVKAQKQNPIAASSTQKLPADDSLAHAVDEPTQEEIKNSSSKKRPSSRSPSESPTGRKRRSSKRAKNELSGSSIDSDMHSPQGKQRSDRKNNSVTFSFTEAKPSAVAGSRHVNIQIGQKYSTSPISRSSAESVLLSNGNTGKTNTTKSPGPSNPDVRNRPHLNARMPTKVQIMATKYENMIHERNNNTPSERVRKQVRRK